MDLLELQNRSSQINAHNTYTKENLALLPISLTIITPILKRDHKCSFQSGFSTSQLSILSISNSTDQRCNINPICIRMETCWFIDLLLHMKFICWTHRWRTFDYSTIVWIIDVYFSLLGSTMNVRVRFHVDIFYIDFRYNLLICFDIVFRWLAVEYLHCLVTFEFHDGLDNSSRLSRLSSIMNSIDCLIIDIDQRHIK
jgi:hypothetical protein